MATEYGEIYYTDIKTDNNGKKWFYINGDTGYDLSTWTEENAKAHYLSFEGYCERLQATYNAWGYYD